MINDFSNLPSENEESSFAQFTPEEHAEFQAYIDLTNEELGGRSATERGFAMLEIINQEIAPKRESLYARVD